MINLDTSLWNEASRLLAKIAGEEIEIRKSIGVIEGYGGGIPSKKFAFFVRCDPNATDTFNVALGEYENKKKVFAIHRIITLRGDLIVEYVFPVVSLPEPDDEDSEDDE